MLMVPFRRLMVIYPFFSNSSRFRLIVLVDVLLFSAKTFSDGQQLSLEIQNVLITRSVLKAPSDNSPSISERGTIWNGGVSFLATLFHSAFFFDGGEQGAGFDDHIYFIVTVTAKKFPAVIAILCVCNA